MIVLTYGGVPVPYAAAWSAEESFRVDLCAYTRQLAICQDVAPGKGKPRFGKPHMQRQREAIARDLCDLCARPLRHRTKVSLSHARPRIGAVGLCIMQVEALLHRECAATSVLHCPSLKRDIAAGTAAIRQVNRYRAQYAIIDPAHVGEYVPGYAGAPYERIVGHAKIELLAWVDRDEAWLRSAAKGGAA